MPKQTKILSTAFKSVLCQQDCAETKSHPVFWDPPAGVRLVIPDPALNTHPCSGIPSTVSLG